MQHEISNRCSQQRRLIFFPLFLHNIFFRHLFKSRHIEKLNALRLTKGKLHFHQHLPLRCCSICWELKQCASESSFLPSMLKLFTSLRHFFSFVFAFRTIYHSSELKIKSGIFCDEQSFTTWRGVPTVQVYIYSHICKYLKTGEGAFIPCPVALVHSNSNRMRKRGKKNKAKIKRTTKNRIDCILNRISVLCA